MNHDRLVTMANQIATFFTSQPGDAAAKATAEHIRDFWDPRMRKGILDHVAGGGLGLDPVALQAVKLVAHPAEPPAAHRS